MSDHEALAVVLGLVVHQLAVTDRTGVSPRGGPGCRRRIHGTYPRRWGTHVTRPSLTLAEAIERGDAVRRRYADRAGTRTDHDVHPAGIVVHGGRWYLAAHDDLRNEQPTFRLDRIHAVLPLRRSSTVVMPDPVAAVHHSLTRTVWTHQVEVAAIADLATAGQPSRPPWARSTRRTATSSCAPAWSRSRVSRRFLASLDLDLRVLSPETLRTHVADPGARLARAAGV